MITATASHDLDLLDDTADYPLPVTLAAQTAARLRAGADAFLRAERPANTTDAYREDWRCWQRFCAAQALPELLVNEDVLVAYVAWMDTTLSYAPATMIRRVSGVVRTLRDMFGLAQVPKGISGRAAEAVTATQRRLGREGQRRGRGLAPLITPDMATAMIDVQPTDTLLGLRNRALLAMWYHLGARREEMSAIDVAHVAEHEDIAVVDMLWAKTGPREPVVARKPGSPYCPLAAYHAWLDAAGIRYGAVFRRLDRHGNVLDRLRPPSVGAVVTDAGRAAGIAVHLTGHGMRAGHVTTALDAGVAPHVVGANTGHDPNGRAMSRYHRIADQAKQNSSAVIELG